MPTPNTGNYSKHITGKSFTHTTRHDTHNTTPTKKHKIMKSNRYFIIEPPKFTDKKWQLVTTTEKSGFVKILSEKKYSLYFASKSLEAILFTARKLGLKMVTIVGEKNRKVRCDSTTCPVNALLLLPELHEQLKSVVGVRYYNARSRVWCVPLAELEKADIQTLRLPESFDADFLVMVRS